MKIISLSRKQLKLRLNNLGREKEEKLLQIEGKKLERKREVQEKYEENIKSLNRKKRETERD